MKNDQKFSPKIYEILSYLLEKAGIIGKIKQNSDKQEDTK